MRSRSSSLFAATLAVAGCALAGCATTQWNAGAPHAVVTLAVAPAFVDGGCDAKEAVAGRARLIAELRRHGYTVVDGAANDVPMLQLTFAGHVVTDAAMHAPDDPRHQIANDLHYAFTRYAVDLVIVEHGQLVARGRAESDRDPSPAVAALMSHVVRDVPPMSSELAAR